VPPGSQSNKSDPGAVEVMSIIH